MIRYSRLSTSSHYGDLRQQTIKPLLTVMTPVSMVRLSITTLIKLCFLIGIFKF